VTFNNMLSDLLATISNAPVAELPHLLGQLREAEVSAMRRLYTPSTPAAPQSERLLDVAETAQRLNVSEDYLYRNWKKLPFARKLEFGLRFSESGLNAYIRNGQKTHLPVRMA
jgi:hypothetical protein